MTITLPSPIVLYRKIREIEKDLLSTELPSEAGPFLMDRYYYVYLLELNRRGGGVVPEDVIDFLRADAQAQAISHELDVFSESKIRASASQGQLVFPKGGILRRTLNNPRGEF